MRMKHRLRGGQPEQRSALRLLPVLLGVLLTLSLLVIAIPQAQMALTALGMRLPGALTRSLARPTPPRPSPVSSTDGLPLNTLNRQMVAAFYRERYLASGEVDSDWNGSHAACDAGSTSPAFRDAILQRVNYFRAMAGVPADIQFLDELNARAQQVALMISANGKLSHTPDSSWSCYSADGAWAAESCNLHLGVYSISAVDSYMEDRGNSNYLLAHRRWLLNTRTRWMGTGDVPAVGGYPAANALWVVGPTSGDRPKTRDPYVAWPPPGYVPYQVVFPRWSVTFDGADFSQASVTMTHHDHIVPVTVLAAGNGPGESTLAWEPHIPPKERPAVDTWYTVQVSNMLAEGGFSNHFQYTVVIFDPDA